MSAAGRHFDMVRFVFVSALIYCMTLGKSFIFPQTGFPNYKMEIKILPVSKD